MLSIIKCFYLAYPLAVSKIQDTLSQYQL